MKFFWVNQGDTYKNELEEGCLWAPESTNSHKVPSHWRLMKEINIGDLIINYSNGFIRGFCVALSNSFQNPKPKFLDNNINYRNEGVLCEVEYFFFENPIPRDVFYENINEFLPTLNSPFNVMGRVNQGYLFKLNEQSFRVILKISNYPYNINGSNEESKETEAEGKFKRRIGHNTYRRKVLALWNGICPITGLNKSNLLVASHIIAWKDGNGKQRLDPYNSILLSPLYDSLFDNYYISFDDDGTILLSSRLTKKEFLAIGINGREKINFFSQSLPYLAVHRNMFISSQK